MTLSYSPYQSTTCQVAESGLHIKQGAVDIYFSHSSAIDELSLAVAPGVGIVWFGHLSLNGATALLVDPQVVLRALNRIVIDTITANSTGILNRFLRTSRPTRDTRNLVFFMLTQSPFLFMTAVHPLSLEINSTRASTMSTSSAASLHA